MDYWHARSGKIYTAAYEYMRSTEEAGNDQANLRIIDAGYVIIEKTTEPLFYAADH